MQHIYINGGSTCTLLKTNHNGQTEDIKANIHMWMTYFTYLVIVSQESNIESETKAVYKWTTINGG